MNINWICMHIFKTFGLISPNWTATEMNSCLNGFNFNPLVDNRIRSKQNPSNIQGCHQPWVDYGELSITQWSWWYVHILCPIKHKQYVKMDLTYLDFSPNKSTSLAVIGVLSFCSGTTKQYIAHCLSSWFTIRTNRCHLHHRYGLYISIYILEGWGVEGGWGTVWRWWW